MSIYRALILWKELSSSRVSVQNNNITEMEMYKRMTKNNRLQVQPTIIENVENRKDATRIRKCEKLSFNGRSYPS